MPDLHPAIRFFSEHHPVSSYLDIRFDEVRRGFVKARVTASAAMVENETSGQVHSGFATLVLDTVMGGGAMGEIEKLQPIATAGLTVQHLRRAIAGEALVCEARCAGIHADIAHMSGILRVEETSETLSTAIGTFMIGTRAKPLGARL